MQLRYATSLTSSDYVTREAWCEARLLCCPRHPGGGCGFARHGTYERKQPPGTRIARWYCPQAQQTFSLLPDCLASRWPGTLVELEVAVTHRDDSASLTAAVQDYRVEIEWAGVVRWLRRRCQAVSRTLSLVRGLMPLVFAGCAPALSDFRRCLGCQWVLVTLREVAAEHLQRLPPPVGFRAGGEAQKRYQQRAGADPPSSLS